MIAILPLMLVASTLAADPDPDAIDEALALAGLQRADLGWTPKGWWPRWPEAPYRLALFDGLFAHPLDTVPFTRGMGRSAWTLLDPATLDERKPTQAGHLLQAVERLGIDPIYGGFRSYSANLLVEPTPLDQAILELTRRAGGSARAHSFGMDLPYPKPAEALAEAVTVLPAGTSPILGRLVLEVAECQRWMDLAFRNVDAADRIAVARATHIGEELVDAFDYAPAFDDLQRDLDEPSLWYASQRAVQALDEARVALQALDLRKPGSFAFDWRTPHGWIRIRGGGKDEVDGHESLLIVDLGGDDTYHGPVAASSALQPISLLLDLEGDDTYHSQGPAQGAGLAGVGILLDAQGDDRYQAAIHGQGAGQVGLGLLADLQGDDRYELLKSGQGFGCFGAGLLFDLEGQDAYQLHADGQGFGGPRGVGLLADRTGDDRYTAIRQHSITGRPSYHSPELDVAVSNAQGVGMGRRGDGSDGHSWAGGLGALLDGEGDDVYTAGNWAMGTGYWFGVGLLHDGAGDDAYHGVAYSQGSGAHFCIGALVDDAGDDQHLAEENSTSSLAWGHDFTVALLADQEGDDTYRVGRNGLAKAINRSIAVLADGAGDDVYETEELARPGQALFDERFLVRDGVHSYWTDTSSLALFLDAGGDDTYWGELIDDQQWLDAPEDPNWGVRNFGLGVDRADGRLDWTPVPVGGP